VWNRRGEPLNLCRRDVAELAAVADGLDRRTLAVADDGVLTIDLELPAWAVASISPAPTTR
jgi:xylan 1,4-beta-xylosidase